MTFDHLGFEPFCVKHIFCVSNFEIDFFSLLKAYFGDGNGGSVHLLANHNTTSAKNDPLMERSSRSVRQRTIRAPLIYMFKFSKIL